ncbi:hypothetical protein predicted by Glimmer/Critica [Salmonella enterica subsp. enterica serovar Weltevreden str. 2007-60-3289-1]|nr:hypothetical protein predicted by Glimmer/Critica [Salmonella enterica subsp. enterica serovar Weltevreden str. 2007-60-3289-1]
MNKYYIHSFFHHHHLRKPHSPCYFINDEQKVYK